MAETEKKKKSSESSPVRQAQAHTAMGWIAYTLLWPPGVISGASNCSEAVGRSTGSLQSADDNIMAVVPTTVDCRHLLCVSVSA